MKEIESLLSKYFDDNKYFSALEELYMLFEQKSIPLKDRKEILNRVYMYNVKLQKQEKEKSNNTIDKGCIVFDNIQYQIVENKDNNKIICPLKLDITNLLSDVRMSKTVEQLDLILPKRGEENFENIIDKLIVELYKEKVYIRNSINSKTENDVEIKQFFQEELEEIDFKIEYLLDYKEYQEEENLLSESNKIIFLKNSYNEPIIFQNLKGYEEYYSSFLELITSIQIGRFKNVKGFVKESKISDISEVKSFKTRVLFAKIKEDTYVILAAFVKKCDWDLRHRNFVGNISQKYQNQKNKLLSNLENPQFMIEEEQYLQQLIDLLSEKKKVKINEIN